jgi:hypothetical protein
MSSSTTRSFLIVTDIGCDADDMLAIVHILQTIRCEGVPSRIAFVLNMLKPEEKAIFLKTLLGNFEVEAKGALPEVPMEFFYYIHNGFSTYQEAVDLFPTFPPIFQEKFDQLQKLDTSSSETAKVQQLTDLHSFTNSCDNGSIQMLVLSPFTLTENVLDFSKIDLTSVHMMGGTANRAGRERIGYNVGIHPVGFVDLCLRTHGQLNVVPASFCDDVRASIQFPAIASVFQSHVFGSFLLDRMMIWHDYITKKETNFANLTTPCLSDLVAAHLFLLHVFPELGADKIWKAWKMASVNYNYNESYLNDQEGELFRAPKETGTPVSFNQTRMQMQDFQLGDYFGKILKSLSLASVNLQRDALDEMKSILVSEANSSSVALKKVRAVFHRFQKEQWISLATCDPAQNLMFVAIRAKRLEVVDFLCKEVGCSFMEPGTEGETIWMQEGGLFVSLVRQGSLDLLNYFYQITNLSLLVICRDPTMYPSDTHFLQKVMNIVFCYDEKTDVFQLPHHPDKRALSVVYKALEGIERVKNESLARILINQVIKSKGSIFIRLSLVQLIAEAYSLNVSTLTIEHMSVMDWFATQRRYEELLQWSIQFPDLVETMKNDHDVMLTILRILQGKEGEIDLVGDSTCDQSWWEAINFILMKAVCSGALQKTMPFSERNRFLVWSGLCQLTNDVFKLKQMVEMLMITVEEVTKASSIEKKKPEGLDTKKEYTVEELRALPVECQQLVLWEKNYPLLLYLCEQEDLIQRMLRTARSSL